MLWHPKLIAVSGLFGIQTDTRIGRDRAADLLLRHKRRQGKWITRPPTQLASRLSLNPWISDFVPSRG
jgi:hypothetical protein